ncbi:ATP-binding cassette domain-containing protein [Desulfofundulus thermobenzoicus]|uniref:ABC transporter ATP-binding protein n=1 Tax=Desulfofundulus thermobenzoicus TaxID=29376 RepID=A0A6N7IR79_9FIRM|nr:ATP-binding cassette domain-containing protein [Desulfofundulus thermobenzoicus]MQL52615.1 ATP-binding cassette domain-containing protein [Desulfofundulus thermobenzoicus]HHW45138.1 ATP-binding cassette domain-containing protein [Desulfotomaculum sp.]
MTQFILEARDVYYKYPDGTEALQGVTLGIPGGGRVAVLGSNGAGKTTLFLHFNGILRPLKGGVFFAGEEVRYDHRSLMQLRKNVGIVFQDPDTQLFSASVVQEISFGPLNLGLSREEVRRRVEEAMAATEIEDLKDKPTHLLSYGQKKRVCIASILAMEPRVLICDEPTAGLDPAHAARVMDLFQRINRQGTTVVLSTHDVDLAYSWADYVLVMSRGTVVGHGLPEEVFRRQELLRQADLTRPWLVEIHEHLYRKGWLPAGLPAPRTREELFDLILTRGAAGPGGLAPVHIFPGENMRPECVLCIAGKK